MTISGQFGDGVSRPRRESDENASSPLTSIARFRNAAEAGYFAHELKVRRNLHVTLEAEEDYDAVTGYWATNFVLFVPENMAEMAAIHLSEMVEQSESAAYVPESLPLDDDFSSFAGSSPYVPDTDEEIATGDNIRWVPIVVTIAAGSLAFWGLKNLWKPAGPQGKVPAKANRDQLWDFLSTSNGRMWVQFDAQGNPIRELEITPDREEAILREDQDGDRVFDRELRFSRP